MKKSAVLAYAALLLALFLPGLRGERPALPAGSAAAAPPVSTVSPAPAAEHVRLLLDGEVRVLPLEEYLVGVLAGEMPASFAPEALKAQAVAARTFALYCAASHKHADADVCGDAGCCQAWLDEERMRLNWGGDYEQNFARLRAAAEQTAGEYLSYEGQPVFAAFHCSSAGATEASAAIWNPRPYLVSVPSPESADTVPRYISRLLCTPLDFRDTLLAAHPEADLSSEPAGWLGPVEHDESGRVASVLLGGVPVRGTELRSLFSLRSTAFTLAYSEEGFCFTVTGSGHGVGMSQYGAEVMARNGADYREILAHYYPGTVLVE